MGSGGGGGRRGPAWPGHPGNIQGGGWSPFPLACGPARCLPLAWAVTPLEQLRFILLSQAVPHPQSDRGFSGCRMEVMAGESWVAFVGDGTGISALGEAGGLCAPRMGDLELSRAFVP